MLQSGQKGFRHGLVPGFPDTPPRGAWTLSGHVRLPRQSRAGRCCRLTNFYRIRCGDVHMMHPLRYDRPLPRIFHEPIPARARASALGDRARPGAGEDDRLGADMTGRADVAADGQRPHLDRHDQRHRHQHVPLQAPAPEAAQAGGDHRAAHCHAGRSEEKPPPREGSGGRGCCDPAVSRRERRGGSAAKHAEAPHAS